MEIWEETEGELRRKAAEGEEEREGERGEGRMDERESIADWTFVGEEVVGVGVGVGMGVSRVVDEEEEVAAVVVVEGDFGEVKGEEC